MAKANGKTQTRVTVHQVSTVELTKRNSGNSLEIEAHRGKDLLGKLVIGQGSIEWWPAGNKTNSVVKTWTQFKKFIDGELNK